MKESSPPMEAIMVSGVWPGQSTGADFAAQSALRIYADAFHAVHFFGPGLESFTPGSDWDNEKIHWVPIPFVRGPIWLRFLRSLFSPEPAITVRFQAARKAFRAAFARIAAQCKEGNRGLVVVFDDLPASSFLPWIEQHYPHVVQVVRSHNILVKGFSGLDHHGSLLERLAWRRELARIRQFERRMALDSDLFWAITEADANDYKIQTGITPDGVFGVSLNCTYYADVPHGNPQTVVHVGSADLRKGKGLSDFIQHTWPLVHKKWPQAKLVLAGRGTEHFSDPALNIEGLGFIEDDRDLLREGMLFINPQEIGAGIQLKSVVAMLAGKALISSPMGVEGIPGDDGKHYFVAQHPQQMAQHIIHLMKNPPVASDMGEAARILATREYSFQRLQETTAPLLEQLKDMARTRQINCAGAGTL